MPSFSALTSNAARAPSTLCRCLLNFEVTNTSSRGTPDAFNARPTPTSFR